MNRSISDFHLLCAHFSSERWAHFCRLQAGRFLSVLFLRSWQQNWLSIPKFWELQRIWCRVFLWMEIFDKYQQNLGDVEWNGNAVQASSPCLLLSKWAANSQGTEENHPLGSHCRDGHGRSLKREACCERMTRPVPTRFPQLWRGLLVNINYQFSIWVQQVPGVYKQNSFNNFISGIHWEVELLFTLQEVQIMSVCVISGWVVVHAGKWRFDPKTLLVNLEWTKITLALAKICSGSFIPLVCPSNLVASVYLVAKALLWGECLCLHKIYILESKL